MAQRWGALVAFASRFFWTGFGCGNKHLFMAAERSTIAFLSSAFPGLDEPGACLMVARYGVAELIECRGVMNVQTGDPITADTTFRLASVTKQFTATLIMMLRRDGLLELDEPVCDLLPELCELSAREITVRHLLQHTAGLLDYEDHVPQGQEVPLSDADVLAITAKHLRNYFRPGTQFRYSNTGYALLACIIERLTEMPFSVALEYRIFKPLGMNNTVARHATVRPEVPNRAIGYRRMPDGNYVECDQNLTSSVLGDGGIYCSANDYLKWDHAYWAGQVLPLDIVKEMTTPGRLLKKGTATDTDRIWFPADMNEKNVHVGQGESSSVGEACYYAGGELLDRTCEIPYGMGWRLETNEENLRVAYHPGSSTGFMHCARHLIDLGLTVLVLANRTVGPSKELARDVEKHLLTA